MASVTAVTQAGHKSCSLLPACGARCFFQPSFFQPSCAPAIRSGPFSAVVANGDRDVRHLLFPFDGGEQVAGLG